MASLFSSGEQGGERDTSKTLPPEVRQLIVDLHAELPTMSWREIAEICYIRYGRRATQFTRHLDKHGYVHFRNWRFFGEDSLAGSQVSVWMYEGTLKIEYQATVLSEYALREYPDHRSIEAVKNPRRTETHFASPQLHLWQRGDTEWLLVMPQPEWHKRKIRRVSSGIVQLSFPEMDERRSDQAL